MQTASDRRVQESITERGRGFTLIELMTVVIDGIERRWRLAVRQHDAQRRLPVRYQIAIKRMERLVRHIGELVDLVARKPDAVAPRGNGKQRLPIMFQRSTDRSQTQTYDRSSRNKAASPRSDHARDQCAIARVPQRKENIPIDCSSALLSPREAIVASRTSVSEWARVVGPTVRERVAHRPGDFGELALVCASRRDVAGESAHGSGRSRGLCGVVRAIPVNKALDSALDRRTRRDAGPAR